MRWRIVQRQVKRYLSGVAGLLLFWFIIRTIKYFFVTDMFWIRQLWYFYYIPITLIPLFAFYIAICLGQGEDFSIGKSGKLLYVPAIIFTMLIITNDGHQLAFRFPTGEAWTDGNGIHNMLYFADTIWVAVLSVAALIIMFRKCRVKQSRQRIWLPFLPLGLALFYTILYVSGVSWLRVVAGDMIVVYSVLIIAVFEACIQCRLIPSNTGYVELFRRCDMPVWIMDGNGEILLASKQGTLQNMMDSRWRLQSVSLTNIENGHAVWAEDVSEILSLIRQLRAVQDRLIDEKELARKEYKVTKRKAEVEEQKHLYLQMQEETQEQLEKLERILDIYKKTNCEAEKRELLKKAALLETYLRRRDTLFLNTVKTPYLPVEEIAFTFRDTQKVLEFYGIEFAFVCQMEGVISGDFIKKMYDFLEQVIEYSLESMTTLLVSVAKTGEKIRFRLLSDCEKDYFLFSSENVVVERDEDGEWKVELELEIR